MGKKLHPDTEQWVLEWSKKSNNLHVQLLAQTLCMNMSRFILDAATPGDYIPIVIGTHDEVTKAADSIRQTLIAREQSRAHDREATHG